MSIKRRVRRLIDHGARRTGLLARWERRLRRAPTLLMYHRVLPDEMCANYPFPSLAMPLSKFEQQIDWLAKTADIVTAREAAAAANGSQPPSARPTIAVTFDDGYWDNSEIASPVLDGYGLRATFFVTSSFVAGDCLMWYDRAARAVARLRDAEVADAAYRHAIAQPSAGALATDRIGAWVEALKQTPSAMRLAVVSDLEQCAGPDPDAAAFRAMKPEDLARLATNGHEIGSHSVSHEILPLLDDARLADELKRPRQLLREWSNQDVAGFCYPNGSFDPRVVAATRAAGYEYACTTTPPGPRTQPGPFQLPRVDITPDRVSSPRGAFDLVAFRAEVCGLHEALR